MKNPLEKIFKNMGVTLLLLTRSITARRRNGVPMELRSAFDETVGPDSSADERRHIQKLSGKSADIVPLYPKKK